MFVIFVDMETAVDRYKEIKYCEVQNGGRCKQIKPGEREREGGRELFGRLNDLPRLHLHLELSVSSACTGVTPVLTTSCLSLSIGSMNQNLNFIYGQVKPPSRLMVKADVKGWRESCSSLQLRSQCDSLDIKI